LSRIAICLVALALACSQDAGSGATSANTRTRGAATVFAFVDVKGRTFSSDTTRGRATVVLFLTTYDIVSQQAARQVEDLLHRREPRFNAGAIVLEAPKYATLVEAFGEALGLSYPLALADWGTRQGGGPFGAISAVPTVVVLDREGRIVWRHSGLPTRDRLGAALDEADGGAPSAP
jgi:hypothetical protein